MTRTGLTGQLCAQAGDAQAAASAASTAQRAPAPMMNFRFKYPV
jgi:hypothetical protein